MCVKVICSTCKHMSPKGESNVEYDVLYNVYECPVECHNYEGSDRCSVRGKERFDAVIGDWLEQDLCREANKDGDCSKWEAKYSYTFNSADDVCLDFSNGEGSYPDINEKPDEAGVSFPNAGEFFTSYLDFSNGNWQIITLSKDLEIVPNSNELTWTDSVNGIRQVVTLAEDCNLALDYETHRPESLKECAARYLVLPKKKTFTDSLAELFQPFTYWFGETWKTAFRQDLKKVNL